MSGRPRRVTILVPVSGSERAWTALRSRNIRVTAIPGTRAKSRAFAEALSSPTS